MESDDLPMSDLTREELNARLETIETRMDGRLSSIEQKIDTKFAEFDSKLQRSNADTIKWVAGIILGVSVAGLALMTFLINNLVPRAAGPSAPVVITLPSAAPVAPPASGRELPPDASGR